MKKKPIGMDSMIPKQAEDEYNFQKTMFREALLQL